MKHRVFKTPSRRRLKKWRSRFERIIHRAGPRGFLWFMRQIILLDPLEDAAKRAGVSLSGEFVAKYTDLSFATMPREQMNRMLAWIMGPNDLSAWADFPTRENLEI
jgi:hypothetical protein